MTILETIEELKRRHSDKEDISHAGALDSDIMELVYAFENLLNPTVEMQDAARKVFYRHEKHFDFYELIKAANRVAIENKGEEG